MWAITLSRYNQKALSVIVKIQFVSVFKLKANALVNNKELNKNIALSI